MSQIQMPSDETITSVAPVSRHLDLCCEEHELPAEAALEAGRDHLAGDRGQEAEDRPDHQADDDHRQRQREPDLQEDLKRARTVGPGEGDLRQVGPAEAGRRVDQDHRERRERHRDDDRPDAEAADEAQPQRGHERQHRRRDHDDDVGGDHLLDERLLGDQRGEQEPDRRADGHADQELLQRHPEVVAVVQAEVRAERLEDGDRPRDHVLGLVRPPQDPLDAEEHDDRDQDDRADLERRLGRPDRRERGPVDQAMILVRLVVEARDLVGELSRDLGHRYATASRVWPVAPPGLDACASSP